MVSEQQAPAKWVSCSAISLTAPNSNHPPPQQVKGGDNQHSFHHIGIAGAPQRNDPQQANQRVEYKEKNALGSQQQDK